MSWLSFDQLIRSCFALDTESQCSDQKKTKVVQRNPLNSSSLQKGGNANKFQCPSPTEKTESILSLSTVAESSAFSSSISKNNDSTPSYLDMSTCRKRRHRRETSQNDVLRREGIEIEGILSSGRFGSSLLARCNKNNLSSSSSCDEQHRMVTLNTYHKTVLTDTYQQHIPQREKEFLEGLEHPFISSVLGSFSDRNCLYLISPLEMGGSLSHLLQNALSHGITDKMKTFYAACVLSVLKYAHGQNIIHRGLHPDSLLIDERGYVKVTDWGFAKTVTDRTYTLCGHVEYLCPEAIVHDSGYGKGADYWAFGVLIYEMFVGRSAFAPSSLDFKYDAKFDVIGASTSAHDRSSSGKSVMVDMDIGLERTPSPSSLPAAGGGGNLSSPLTGDLDLQDPLGHDTGTIENILTRDPVYPSYMPHPTKSIVQGLCQKNMTQRLGTRRGGKGIEDIQKHIFFQDMEWARLNQKLVAAPWMPTVTSAASDGAATASVAASSVTHLSSVKECTKHYPHFMNKLKSKEVDLYGPAFSGYNCPDWNAFV